MPEETPQLPVSEQEVQIEAPSLLDKLKLQKKKILIGLGSFLGVLLLAGAAFGVYKYAQRQLPLEPVEGPTPTPEVVTPTPDPTANWETYMNEEYGYSIKYPQEIAIREDKTQDYVYFEFPEQGKWIASLSIKHYQNPQGLEPQSFWQKLFEEEKLEAQRKNWPTPIEPLESEIIKIDNLEGFQIRNSAYEAYQRATYSGKGKTMVAISFYDENPNDPFQEEHLVAFNSILSTFKFLEEENCVKTDTGESMTLTEAKEIALKSECVKEGNLKETYLCNDFTGTWWLDLEIDRPGCAPACMVNVVTKEAEINWRCTGLITP